MAINRPTTYASDLFIPEVIGNAVEQKYVDLMKFTPFVEMDYTLAAGAGDTVTLPVYAYIGDAEDVAEGEAIPYSKLTQSTTTEKVKKAGKGVDITDEAAMSAYGDPAGETVNQLALAIASKLDNDIVAELGTIGGAMTVDKSTEVINANAIAETLVKFGEEIDAPNVMFISPSQLASIRKDENWIPASEIAAEIKMAGTIGQIFNTQLIVTNKIKENAGSYENYIVRMGAIRVYLKRDVLVETDRDIDTKTTRVNCDKHYVVSLADVTKAIKVKFGVDAKTSI